MVAETQKRTQQNIPISEMTLQDFFAGVYMITTMLNEVQKRVIQAGIGNYSSPDHFEKRKPLFDRAYEFADKAVAYRQNHGRPTEDVVGY